MRQSLVSALLAGLTFGFAFTNAAEADELVWEVMNPFRFYKSARSFKLHEDAFAAVRSADGAVPDRIVERIEHCLNDPDLLPAEVASGCRAIWRNTSREARRQGWAARTLEDVCYVRNGARRHYPARCTREQNGRRVAEDYVLPAAHSVSVTLAPNLLAETGEGRCSWSWRPRAGGEGKSAALPCREKLVIDRVPFSTDQALSGVAVEVKLPNGGTVSDPEVRVDDVLVVALGDSFASGEGNPDRPVAFNPTIPIDYRLPRDEPATALFGRPGEEPEGFETAAGNVDPFVLPRRMLKGETAESRIPPQSDRFKQAFWESSAGWLSADCHRSQYAYPVRVGLQLALENRHRAVTLVHLACSGAEMTDGLLGAMEPREDKAKTKAVVAQFAQLTELLCRPDARRFQRNPPLRLPVFENPGSAAEMRAFPTQLCGAKGLKRAIDLVLLSIGGNDVGFSALAAYVMLDNLSDVGWVAAALDRKMRYGPSKADVHLEAVDERLQAVKSVLAEGFGVEPTRVVQTSYEPIQFDERGGVCGAHPALGMDVHSKLRLNGMRLTETSAFVSRLLKRLDCTASLKPGCPSGLKTGPGTGFTLITSHQAEFAKRGVCARGRGDADGAMMQMPRYIAGEFKPFNPADFRPYASRQRLFRTPNDAFLTANTHREETIIFDILQPAFAALYSGALHPTAEGHAIVADHVLPHARAVLDGRAR